MLYASVATLCLVWFLLSFEHVQCRSTGQVNEYSSRSSPTRRCLRSCFLISGHQTCYEKCLGRNKEGDFNLNARIMRIPPHLTPSLKRRKRNANGFSKKCYTCQSAVSWEDCLKNSKVFECKKRYPGIPEADLACITLARSKLRTWNQQIVHFAKFCLPKNMCDKEKCEKDMLPREEYNITKARGCDIECCSGDICNDGKLPVVALAEVTGFSKKCYTCQSAISWEDCLKNRKGFECKNLYPGIPEADPACITVARSKLGTWNQQIAHFATFCSPKNMCDKEKCEKDMLPREEYKITKGRRCVN